MSWFAPSHDPLRRALNTTVLDMLRPVALWLGLLYLAYAVAHTQLLGPEIRWLMAGGAALTGAALLLIAGWLRRHALPPQRAHLLAAVICALVIWNTVAHLVLTREVRQTTNVAIVMIGISSLLLSIRWWAALNAALLAGWALAVTRAPDDGNLTHYAIMLVAAALLGTLLITVRLRVYRQLHGLLQRDAVQRAELEQALDQLRHNERALIVARDAAERANRAKSGFMAHISHELRTPLTSVIGYGDMLLDGARRRRAAEDVADLEQLLRSSWHLLELVNGLLDVARAESGKLNITLVDVPIQPLLDELLSTVRPLGARQGNTLRLVSELTTERLVTDQTRLRQVLLNLLSNACKFTERGTVTLTVTLLQPPGAPDWTAAQFVVSDTGGGLPPDVQARLFEEYVQDEQSVQLGYGSSGLGLSLSHRLCALIGGELEYQRLPGGAQFRFTLPRRPQLAEQPAPI